MHLCYPEGQVLSDCSQYPGPRTVADVLAINKTVEQRKKDQLEMFKSTWVAQERWASLFERGCRDTWRSFGRDALKDPPSNRGEELYEMPEAEFPRRKLQEAPVCWKAELWQGTSSQKMLCGSFSRRKAFGHESLCLLQCRMIWVGYCDLRLF